MKKSRYITCYVQFGRRLMNSRMISTIVFIALSLLVACGEPELENQAPTISFIAPSDNGAYTQGEVITFSVEVGDPEEDIKEVRFYSNDVGIGSDQNWPYSFEWETSNVNEGIYTIRAEAIDNGNAKSYAEISIRVFEGSIAIDHDGNVYHTVVIGDQWWMAENLKVSHYRDGTPINYVTDNSAWATLTTEAYCIYINNSLLEVNNYGALYNWYAVNGDIDGDGIKEKEIAPEGWHVPEDAEWQILIDYLGGSGIAGGKLKESGTNHWSNPNEGATNESEFTVLPGGLRDFSNGTYNDMGDYAGFWTATESGSGHPWAISLFSNYSGVNRSSTLKGYGLSVRCVKD